MSYNAKKSDNSAHLMLLSRLSLRLRILKIKKIEADVVDVLYDPKMLRDKSSSNCVPNRKTPFCRKASALVSTGFSVIHCGALLLE